MGKRKRATKPPPKKKRPKLNKQFDCPFCGHEQTVDCYLERDEKVGRVECRVCGAKFRAIINHLDEEIDMYHKWIDACEEASKEKEQASAAASYNPAAVEEEADVKDTARRVSGGDIPGSGERKRSVDDFVDEDDDFVDDEQDAEDLP